MKHGQAITGESGAKGRFIDQYGYRGDKDMSTEDEDEEFKKFLEKREKAKAEYIQQKILRNGGCAFCNDEDIKLTPCANGDHNLIAMIHGDIDRQTRIEDNFGIMILNFGRGLGFFDIKYCPICGRKLEARKIKG
jgi:hypothetical protein